MIRKLWVSQKGMTTVEACIIIPITIWIFIGLVWTGVAQYNRMVINQAVYMAAIKGAQYSEKTKAEIEEIAINRLDELLEDRLVLVKDITYDVEVTALEVKVQFAGEYYIFAHQNYRLILEVCKSAPRIKASSTIRTANRIRNSLSENQIEREQQTASENRVEEDADASN